MAKCFYSILAVLLLFSCAENQENGKLFTQLSAKQTGVNFANDLPLDDDLHILNYIYYFNGGGVAAGDLNNDGLDDLFFTGNQVSSKLYLNKGDFKFDDITLTAGVETNSWASGVTMVDINADGWLDIYVCVAGEVNPSDRKNKLFINLKNNTFKESASIYGLADESYSTQAAFFDYDLDGDLDMYLMNHMHKLEGLNNPKKKKVNGESESTDKLYRNDGVGTDGHPVFTDVSTEAGITIEGYGLGLGISDVNLDGYPDIYVSNDFVTNDLLWINQGDGTFKNKISTYIKHQSHNGMGNDIADINNDGLNEIIVMDMLPQTNQEKKTMLNKPNFDFFEYGLQLDYQPQYMRNTLQLNQGENHFSEIGQFSGVSETDWSWASLFADFDMDGFRDLYITNGYLKDMTNLDFIVYRKKYARFASKKRRDSIYLKDVMRLPEDKVTNFFYKNNTDLTFKNISKEWANEKPTFSNGAVYADLDNDGDLDVVTNNINEAATVLKNNSIKDTLDHKYVTVNFKGKKNNPSGIGAKVWIYSDGKTQYAENFPVRGFQSSVPPYLNFGIPADRSIDSIKVGWVNGYTETINNIKTNTKLTFSVLDAKQELPSSGPVSDKLFKNVSTQYGIDYVHVENPFSDFKVEPLIPHRYSYNGPSIAVSDINGDGLDDFFIGGSFQNSGQLFTQKSNGTFAKNAFEHGKEYEDMGALFFDADNDGDQDLYVISGSSEFGTNRLAYKDRLYINDGKGNFTENENSLPKVAHSGSCVTAADYDKDGDLDLFVGSRVVPKNYGLSPLSYVLENKNGKFVDVTQQILGEENLGMISTALWTDYDNDGWQDLMIAGEWMPITIYKNNNGVLKQKITLENSNGWWNSLNGGDFDNDGDIDYIAGNLGENSPYKASTNYPMTLYLNDFDKDGKDDPIITTYAMDSDGVKREYPFVSRDLLADQMIFIKNKFTTYQKYATATIEDLKASEDEEISSIKKTNFLKSAFIENLGNGDFAIRELPREAQLAPIMGTSVDDFNLDGNLDVLITGNFYMPEVGYGRYDASTGLLLEGDGKGNFNPRNFTETGFLVDGDSRSLAKLNVDGKNLMLATQNNDSLKAFSYPSKKQKHIRVPDDKASALINYPNGKHRKIEFYKGEGYLSQSTRIITLPENATIEYN